jgi:hypothetical protein
LVLFAKKRTIIGTFAKKRHPLLGTSGMHVSLQASAMENAVTQLGIVSSVLNL